MSEYLRGGLGVVRLEVVRLGMVRLGGGPISDTIGLGAGRVSAMAPGMGSSTSGVPGSARGFQVLRYL